jgi:hypothetical protein
MARLSALIASIDDKSLNHSSSSDQGLKVGIAEATFDSAPTSFLSGTRANPKLRILTIENRHALI